MMTDKKDLRKNLNICLLLTLLLCVLAVVRCLRRRRIGV